jgi:hypothetical protein
VGLARFNPAAVQWLQRATAVVIIAVGGAMTLGALRQIVS